ncbi:cytochrome c family protein [Humisphaera borealis]|uniref:Cytochrome c domain-containing protein n=1 Tax=Humisphaera borealis TaxID=2807512 RepID=A0A7M2WZI7_9BACT|nr:hypothetical protein [Humisphaera borealis]QOV90271.1 hypothetical protein IPV69_02550 [Humisphaera borealis]
MIRFVVTVSILCIAQAASASLVVPGFERFHAGREASAAGGKLLVTELSCTACHAAPQDAELQPKKGPILDGIAMRVSADWLRAFLADPQKAKPGSTMPDMLAALPADKRAGAVEALVHLLATQTKTDGKPEKLSGNISADRGMLLFHEIGCVSCHAPDPAFKPLAAPTPAANAATKVVGDTPARSVPLPDLKAKYSLETLARFLRNPLEHRPAGRMPDLMIDPQEAVDLAGYLVGWNDVRSTGAPKVQTIKPDPKRVAEGRALFASLGCASCHALEGQTKVTLAKPLADLAAFDTACVGPKPAAGTPHFELSPVQRQSISLAVKPGKPAAAGERVVATMERLNCYGCHQRDDKGGVLPSHERFYTGDPDLADEGRFPPKLTGVGRKLTPAWFEKVLGREGRVRPYLRMRMPVFAHDAVKHLPADFIAADGGMRDDAAKALPGGDVEAGRQLLGAAGLSCITCHGLNGKPSIGIHALDITGTTERLQPAWFKQNLLNPAAVRPGTLMPSFWPEGKAANANILGGDVDKQISSIWAYLREGKTPIDGYPPAKGEFELVADEKPVIIRCFMEAAGTHAIAVGFPQKVHIAFDANTIRPAIAWRGKFLDAYTTWFSRAQPPVDPLGDAVVALPGGMPLAKLPSASDAWPKTLGTEAGYTFGGYRLDKQGVPTFLYKFGEIAVEDRIVPTDDGKGLTRTLVLRGGGGEGVYFMPTAVGAIGGAPAKGANAPSLKVTVLDTRTEADGKPIPVTFEKGVATLKVEYRW